MNWLHPTGGAPKSVCILGLGPSKQALIELMCSVQERPPWDELWTCNGGMRIFDHDLCFDIHDIEAFCDQHPYYIKEYENLKKPLIACREVPGLPKVLAYPLQCVQD